MKRFAYIAAAVLGLIIAAAMIVPFLVPNEVYRNQIEKAATNALGRQVTLGGEARVSLFPRISASIEDVTVANPDGFDDPNMVEAGALRGVVKWGPLLARRVEIDELAFEDATVRLQRLSDGRANWEFGEPASDEPATEDGSGGSVSAGVSRIRITNANVSYDDAVAGQSYALEDFTGSASLQALDRPLKASGEGRFQDQAFDFDLAIASVEAALAGEATDTNLDFGSSLANFAFDGTLALGDALAANGKFSASSSDLATLAAFAELEAGAPLGELGALRSSGAISGPLLNPSLQFDELSLSEGLLDLDYSGTFSLAAGGQINGALDASSTDLRALLQAFGVELSPGETLRSFRLSAAPTGSPDAIDLSDLDFQLDDIMATGSAGVDLTGARPKVVAALILPTLDLTPFMSTGEQAQQSQPASEGWSKDKLDLAGLKAVDADLDLNVGELTIDKITLRDADFTANLRNGVLTTDITRLTAFGGAWAGAFGLDASGATPKITMALDGSSIAMNEMLSTFAGVRAISGEGALKLNASAEGDSLDAIVRALDGSISTNLANGAMRGFDAAKLVRSASDIRAAIAGGDFGLAVSPSAQTEFANFESVLTIENGVANVDVLNLLNPVLALDGSGKIDLGGQSLDLSILTSIDKAATGNASAIQLNGIPVPIRLSGSWTSPKITPDTRLLQQALTSELQGRAADELTDRIGGELSGVLGLPNRRPASNTPEATPTDEEPAEDEEEEPSAEEQIEDAARDAISDLFRRND